MLRLYTDEEFSKVVNAKIGVIRFFKKKLKQNNLLKNREKLNDNHIEMFNNIVNYREQCHCPWGDAVINEIGMPQNNNNNKNLDLENYDLLIQNNKLLLELLSEMDEIKNILNKNNIK